MKIGTVLAILGLLFLFCLREEGIGAASVAQVQSLVVIADQSAAAKAFVVGALAENPAPTVNELAQMDRHVNEILVRDVSAAAAGDQRTAATAEAALIAQPAAKQASDAKPEDAMYDALVTWGALLTIVLLVGKAVFVFRRVAIAGR
jgi:hypothetical protein